MCGVAGIVSPDGEVRGLLERLTEGLAHRGPDGAGCQLFANGRAGIGHRRLSIVDLATGQQPMSNEAGTIWVSYNGEIYNHLDLRAELERAGYRFRTRADTEVLIHGWDAWGNGLWPRLNGIYALALVDLRHRAGTVWLARDPAGVKPLYLGVKGRQCWFASELTAARRAGLVDPDISSEALAQFLVYRFVPAPRTIYRSVWKLPPGHTCRIVLDAPIETPEFLPFRHAFEPAALPASRAGWETAIREGLTQAVRRQLMSDVPVGSLLSGGVDSSVITRLMVEAGPQAPQAFAIGVVGAGPLDELVPARRAAAALGVPLNETSVTRDAFLSAWPSQIIGLGEPVANSGVLLLGLLCRTVRRSHKVVLTGQGADEPLGGYPRHAAERWYGWLGRMPGLVGLVPARWGASDRVERLRRIMAQSDVAHRYADILAVFPPAAVPHMVRAPLSADSLAEPVRHRLGGDRDEHDSLNDLLRVDAGLSLADDLLLVADHTSMAQSVELRVPFLDLPLLALMLRMPSRYKVSPLGERKWLYRRAVRPLLPRELAPLAGRRQAFGRKLGFSSPVDQWLDHWAGTSARQFLLGPEALLPDLMQPGALEAVLDQHAAGRPRGRQLLSLYVMETWLRHALGTERVREVA